MEVGDALLSSVDVAERVPVADLDDPDEEAEAELDALPLLDAEALLLLEGAADEELLSLAPNETVIGPRVARDGGELLPSMTTKYLPLTVSFGILMP